MSPLNRSNNIAARAGRWSAGHRKTAIFGWLAFVIASVVIGGVSAPHIWSRATQMSAKPRRRIV